MENNSPVTAHPCVFFLIDLNTSRKFRYLAEMCVIITQSVSDMLCLFCRRSHPPFAVVSISSSGCGSASVLFRKLISSQLQSLHFLALRETWITPENSAMPAALSFACTFFFFHFSLHKELGTGPQACFCLRNGTSHLMHFHTLTFNHLNSMLLLLSSYYCYLSPTWPLEKLHRRAESLLRRSL